MLPLIKAFVDDLSPRQPVRFSEKEMKAAPWAARRLFVNVLGLTAFFESNPRVAMK